MNFCAQISVSHDLVEAISQGKRCLDRQSDIWTALQAGTYHPNRKNCKRKAIKIKGCKIFFQLDYDSECERNSGEILICLSTYESKNETECPDFSRYNFCDDCAILRG